MVFFIFRPHLFITYYHFYNIVRTMKTIKKYRETLTAIDFSNQNTEREDYESCEFLNCTFTDVSNLNFVNCLFRNCNLSNMKANNTKLQEIEFADCKLLGINFSRARDFAFEISCKNCNLDYVSFDSKKMNKSSFENCKMHGINFTRADLSKATFIDCDFFESVFNNTNLSGVDFTKAKQFSIDPSMNNVKKAKFLIHDLPCLLEKFDLIIE